MAANFAVRKGFVAKFHVSDPIIGGVVVVWDSAKTPRNRLPQKKFLHRWVIVHHDDFAMSPGGLSFATKKVALKNAEELAKGAHKMKLRRIGRELVRRKKPATAKKKSAKNPVESQQENPQQPAVVNTAEDRERHLIAALEKIDAKLIVAKLKGCLEATYFVRIVDSEGKATKEERPDYKIQLQAISKILEYKYGRAIERKEIVERQEVDYATLEDKLRHSKLYRDRLRIILDRMDAESL